MRAVYLTAVSYCCQVGKFDSSVEILDILHILAIFIPLPSCSSAVLLHCHPSHLPCFSSCITLPPAVCPKSFFAVLHVFLNIFHSLLCPAICSYFFLFLARIYKWEKSPLPWLPQEEEYRPMPFRGTRINREQENGKNYKKEGSTKEEEMKVKGEQKFNEKIK